MRAIIPTIVVLVVLGVLYAIFTGFWTDRQWYGSLGYGSVFSTTLVTRIGLFAVFGLVFGAAVFANLAIAYRLRPRYRAMSNEQQTLDRYRDVVDPHKTIVGVAVAVVLALIAGSSASSRWDTFMQWRNAEPFGVKDQQFQVDVSFYLFGYPWYRFLLGYGFAVVILCLIAALVAHYLYGGIRLQTQGQKASAAAQAHISVLLGLFVLLKAVAYWFDRYGLMLGTHRLSNRTFTGLTYSDAHALLPAKTILTIIAAICAILFFANVVRKTWLLPGLGLGLLVLSAVLLGWLWPTVVQGIHVRPNEPDLEKPFIEFNIAATRSAYDVDDAKVTPYSVKTKVTRDQLSGEDEKALPGIRLVDPKVVPQTFEQLRQVRGFYKFKDPLDVDRYKVDGKVRDAVVAVREITLEGVPAEQRNWNNDHTVYTHGYGFVAAYGNRKTSEGSPEWMEAGFNPSGKLGQFEPRIYFGEDSPPYSIVGGTATGPKVELDVPSGSGEAGTNYTYQGKGGVPIGGFFNRLLFASKLQDFNILLSDRINSDSRILYDREPQVRVQKAAPWLSVDSDVYPAIVDGRIKWIVDGYTMSDSYPQSQRLDILDATSDSLSGEQQIVGQPSEQVNYIRNSVKAVVDAYDGSVDLYQWDKQDPLLKTWMKAFPGTVKPREQVPNALLDHFRYPEDLMKLQREILTQYHVTDPKTFYGGTERWQVPADPTQEKAGLKQPAYYLSVRMPDQEQADFSLTSTYVYANKENLSAFVAVDADPRSKDYGQIRILDITGVDDGSAKGQQGQVDGPKQIANALESNTRVRTALLPYRQAGSQTKVISGNLLTLPTGGGLLYVQPVYLQRTGTGSYPVLNLVLASFGGRIGVGETLDQALAMVFDGEAETPTDPTDPGKDPTTPSPGANAGVVAEFGKWKAAVDKANAALKAGNLGDYQKFTKEAESAARRAYDAYLKAGAGKTDTNKSSPSPTPTPTATPKR